MISLHLQLTLLNEFPSIITAFPLNYGQFSDPWPPLQNPQFGTVGGFASLNKADAVDTFSMNGGFLFRLRFPERFLLLASGYNLSSEELEEQFKINLIVWVVSQF